MLPGVNRILYQAAGFDSGIVVTAKLLKASDLSVITAEITFSETPGDPIYYADVNFPFNGKYYMIVYEGGQRMLMTTFEIGGYPGIVTVPRIG